MQEEDEEEAMKFENFPLNNDMYLERDVVSCGTVGWHGLVGISLVMINGGGGVVRPLVCQSLCSLRRWLQLLFTLILLFLFLFFIRLTDVFRTLPIPYSLILWPSLLCVSAIKILQLFPGNP